jgi:uncharacterized protein YfdQ (DUF2303 family)
MDESAVKLIQQTAIAANDNRQSRMPEGTIALPDNFTIHDLEKYLPERRRFRGRLETASLADFVNYVKENRGDNQGFIDADNLSARVFFNLGDVANPEHGDWTANLKIKSTAAYRALLGVNGQHLIQRDLIEWLEDWNVNVVQFFSDSDDGYIAPGSAIEAIRKIEIKSKKDSTHVEQERRASRSAMEEVEASAGPSLPSRIAFRCEPYLGLPTRDFILRLQVLTSHDDPRLILRVAELEQQQEMIAQDFKEVLIREVGDAATMTIGTFNP